MKLKILIATACVAMACSAAVSAETTNVTGTGAGTVQSEAAEQTKMLAVNKDDTINITVNTTAGSDVTLLSYKYDEPAASDNIQYVDQYVAGDDGKVDITYKIRELVEKDGVYCLKINDGSSGGVKTVYYKVGAPELVSADGSTTTTYYKKVSFGSTGDRDGINKDTTSVAYKATYKINGNINEYGFSVTLNKTATSLNKVDAEISSNEGDFAFGITIYGISPDEEGLIEKIEVTPIVNYTTTTAE